MINNKNATVGLPTYILVAIIVSSVIITIFFLGIFNIFSESQVHNAETQVDRIVSEAENMFEYADEGSLITVDIDFPGSMKFVVFGGLPENGIGEPTDFTLEEDSSNNYYFVMNDGTIHTGHTHARFSGENTNQIAYFSKGKYSIKLELVKQGSDKTYVKIY